MAYFYTGLEPLLEKIAVASHAGYMARAQAAQTATPVHTPAPAHTAQAPIGDPYRTPAPTATSPSAPQAVPGPSFGQRAGQAARSVGKGIGYGLAGAGLLAGTGTAWALSKQKEEDDRLRGSTAWTPMQGTPGTSYMG